MSALEIVPVPESEATAFTSSAIAPARLPDPDSPDAAAASPTMPDATEQEPANDATPESVEAPSLLGSTQQYGG